MAPGPPWGVQGGRVPGEWGAGLVNAGRHPTPRTFPETPMMTLLKNSLELDPQKVPRLIRTPNFCDACFTDSGTLGQSFERWTGTCKWRCRRQRLYRTTFPRLLNLFFLVVWFVVGSGSFRGGPRTSPKPRRMALGDLPGAPELPGPGPQNLKTHTFPYLQFRSHFACEFLAWTRN